MVGSRGPTTWTLVIMGRSVDYDNDDQPNGGTATITTQEFPSLDDLAEEVERTVAPIPHPYDHGGCSTACWGDPARLLRSPWVDTICTAVGRLENPVLLLVLLLKPGG